MLSFISAVTFGYFMVQNQRSFLRKFSESTTYLVPVCSQHRLDTSMYEFIGLQDRRVQRDCQGHGAQPPMVIPESLLQHPHQVANPSTGEHLYQTSLPLKSTNAFLWTIMSLFFPFQFQNLFSCISH